MSSTGKGGGKLKKKEGDEVKKKGGRRVKRGTICVLIGKAKRSGENYPCRGKRNDRRTFPTEINQIPKGG